jgi:hypothetical protein
MVRVTISRWPSHQGVAYRQYALLYCLLVGLGRVLLQRRGLKPNFFGTHLTVVANVLFSALLSGVFNRQGYGVWFLAQLRLWRVSLLGPDPPAICLRCLFRGLRLGGC